MQSNWHKVKLSFTIITISITCYVTLSLLVIGRNFNGMCRHTHKVLKEIWSNPSN